MKYNGSRRWKTFVLYCNILLRTKMGGRLLHTTDLRTGRSVPLLRVPMRSWSLDKGHNLLIQRFLLSVLQWKDQLINHSDMRYITQIRFYSFWCSLTFFLLLVVPLIRFCCHNLKKCLQDAPQVTCVICLQLISYTWRHGKQTDKGEERERKKKGGGEVNHH